MIKLDKKPNILVIGDLMIDHYLWGSCDRISPEAPVQVVNVKKESSVLGGAGNVINNLVTLGSVVDVISVIGNDSVANELKSLLEKIDVPTSNLVVENNRKEYIPNPYIGSYQFFTEANILTTKKFLDYEPRFSLEDGIKAYIPEIKRLFAEEVK